MWRETVVQHQMCRLGIGRRCYRYSRQGGAQKVIGAQYEISDGQIKCVQPDSKTGNPSLPPPPPPNFDGHPYPQDSLAAIEAVASAAIKGESSSSSHHNEYAETGMSENGDGLPALPCEGCAKVGLPCTYDYVRKKPGRKNSYVCHPSRAGKALSTA